MSPLVTIGIPCFNAATWLREAIESALTQTHENLEVIVVDDGSTDDSREVAAQFGERIRTFPQSNLGACAARNVALREARGEWVQFLDADDCLDPWKLEHQFAQTQQGSNADVIYSPVWIEEKTSPKITDATIPDTYRYRSNTSPDLDIYTQWITWQIPQTGGCLWRKSALEALGGWREDQHCCQEHELYLRALQAGLRFVFAPATHAIYRVLSENSLCRRDPCRVHRERTRLIDQMHAWLVAQGRWTAEHQQAAGRACFEMARMLAKYDLAAAEQYHRERLARGLIHLDGPAAPTAYQVAYRLLGFAAAEKLAAARR